MYDHTCESNSHSGRRLLFSWHVIGQLEDHAMRAYPYECCGILIGSGDEVERVMAGENMADGDRRRQYQIDWGTLFESVRDTRDGPSSIVGFYHSHPDGTYQPSWLDRQHAWIDHNYLILGVTDQGVMGMSCWRARETGAPFVSVAIDRVASR